MAGKKSKPPAEWERVLVRHVRESQRDDIFNIDDLLSPPFGSSSRSMSPSSDHNELRGRPSARWMVAAHFKDQDWIALFCNCAVADKLIAANVKCKRLEIAHIGYSPERGGWFAKILSAGRLKVDFHHAHDAGVGFAEFEKVCVANGLSPKQYEIRPGDRKFELISPHGRPVQRGLRGYIYFSGDALTEGENPASDQLKRAIERGDPDAVRTAIKCGASLEAVPDFGGDPLAFSLTRCGRPGWREIAELLAAQGCRVDGDPNGEPPIISETWHLASEDRSLAAVQVLLDLGADIEAVGFDGTTALARAASNCHPRVVELLLAHGANPNAIQPDGRTIVESIRERVEKQLSRGDRQHVGILERLTGANIDTPPKDELAQALDFEIARLRTCGIVRNLLKAISPDVEFEVCSANSLAKRDRYAAAGMQLQSIGFEEFGHYLLSAGAVQIEQTVFLHRAEAFSATIAMGGPYLDQVRVEMGVFHHDETLTVVANVENGPLLDYQSPTLNSEVIPGATAEQLLSRLRENVGSAARGVVTIPRENFAAHFKAFNAREIIHILEYLRSVLDTPRVFVEGRPARFELARCFLDLFRDDNPTWGSKHFADDLLRNLERTRISGPSRRFGCAITQAGELAALKCLDFAGAPADWDFLGVGVDEAVRFFKSQSKRRQPFAEEWAADRLVRGWLCAMLAGRWDDVRQISESLSLPFATTSAPKFPPAPMELALLLLCIASHFRAVPFPEVPVWQQRIADCGRKRLQLQCKAWEALAAGEADPFQAAITQSLEQLVTTRPETWRTHELADALGWIESILLQIAAHEGLAVPDLPDRLDARILWAAPSQG